jgi:hypothetical protein
MIHLPGYELIQKGLEDLRINTESYYTALLYSAETRLLKLGIELSGKRPDNPAMLMYSHLKSEFGDGAHSKYNALNRRLLSFCKAREMELENS